MSLPAPKSHVVVDNDAEDADDDDVDDGNDVDVRNETDFFSQNVVEGRWDASEQLSNLKPDLDVVAAGL